MVNNKIYCKGKTTFLLKYQPIRIRNFIFSLIKKRFNKLEFGSFILFNGII